MAMQVEYRLNDRTTLKANVNNEKGVIQAIGKWEEIFNDPRTRKCGCCGSENTRLGHRSAQGYDFYEFICCDCEAQFKISEYRDQTLGMFLDHRTEWKPRPARNEEQGGGQQQQRQAPQQQQGRQQQGWQQQQSLADIPEDDIPF